MRQKFVVSILFISCFGAATSSEGVGPEQAGLKETARYDSTIQGSLISAVRKVSEVFRVPISLEWSAVEENGSSIPYPTLTLDVRKGETLSAALDGLVVSCSDSIKWELINGIICVRPTDKYEKLESLLDIHVTLKLENVSTWHAFVELAREVNNATEGERFLMPVPMPTDEGNTPPLALRDLETITLNVTDTAAREVACEIMRSSPLSMEFRYSNDYRIGAEKPSARITLWCFDAERRLLSGPPRAREKNVELWSDEARSALPTTKDIVPHDE